LAVSAAGTVLHATQSLGSDQANKNRTPGCLLWGFHPVQEAQLQVGNESLQKSATPAGHHPAPSSRPVSTNMAAEAPLTHCCTTGASGPCMPCCAYIHIWYIMCWYMYITSCVLPTWQGHTDQLQPHTPPLQDPSDRCFGKAAEHQPGNSPWLCLATAASTISSTTSISTPVTTPIPRIVVSAIAAPVPVPWRARWRKCG